MTGGSEQTAALSFSALVRAMGSPDKVSLRTRLSVSDQVLNRYSAYGLDEPTGRRLAAKARLDPAEVWPTLAAHNGSGTAPEGATPPRRNGHQPPAAADAQIVWEDPPADHRPGRPRKDWVSLLTPFLARPGVWGRLPGDYSNGTVSNIRKAEKAGQLPAGCWEFTARAISGSAPKRSHVYARWLEER